MVDVVVAAEQHGPGLLQHRMVENLSQDHTGQYVLRAALYL
jgi:hypothetical protein